jgi:hypothetical protein
MKNSLVWLVVSWFLIGSVIAQSESGDPVLVRPEPRPQGRVRSLRAEVSRFDDQAGQWVKASESFFVYNPKGNLLEEDWSGVEDESVWKSKWVYRYDAKGNMIEKTMYDAEGFVLKWVYTYNAQGKKIGGASYRAGETLESEETYTYDPQGRLTEQVQLTVDGVGLRQVNTYDAQGRLIKALSYHGRELPTTVKTYTATGWTSETVFYQSDGTPRFRMVISCDNKARWAEIRQYKAEGVLESRTTCTADAKLRVTRCLVYTADGSVDSQEVIVSDAKGYVTEVASYRADGSVKKRLLYGYEFDAKGNWIKKTKSEWITKNGKSFFEPRQIISRTITYY